MRRIRRIFYDDLWKEQRPGLYVFCDQDMLTKRERIRLGKICDRLEADPEHYTFLNHPHRFMERNDLLRTLHEKGINPFKVYDRVKVTEETHYPVFVRRKWDGMSNPSRLLRNREEVEAYKKRLKEHRLWFAVELCDTQDEERIYRKYGTYCIGDRMIPRHLLKSTGWMVKDRNMDSEGEEEAFVNSPLFLDELRCIFRIAGIDYGRVDYALKDGKPVIWEINTAPCVVASHANNARRARLYDRFFQSYLEALRDLLPPAVAESDLNLIQLSREPIELRELAESLG